MPGVPRLVRLAVPRSLAGLCATRTLSPAHPRVGQKPSSAYATRSLLAHGARDHRRPRAWPPATDTTDHAQPLPQPPPPRARPLATAHHRPRPAAGHGPPPTTPSRRPRPPPTTPSCCRSAQWVTSDEQPRVTSRKRRSHDDPRRRYARPRPRPSSSGVRTAALDGRDSCSAVRRSENQNEILGEGLRRGPLGCGRRRRC